MPGQGTLRGRATKSRHKRSRCGTEINVGICALKHIVPMRKKIIPTSRPSAASWVDDR